MAALTDPYGMSVLPVAFSPDGRILAVGSFLWDVGTRHQIAELDANYGYGSNYAVAFSPDGRTLAVAIGNDSSFLWNVATRHVIAQGLGVVA